MEITSEQLETCAKKLFVYDVEQGAWEQERNGIKANLEHTLTHFAKDMTKKDYADRVVARMAIAPDCLQFAIRLARWTGQSAGNMTVDEAVVDELKELPLRLSSRSFGQLSATHAMSIIGDSMHSYGHASEKRDSVYGWEETARRAGSLLVHCATIQAGVYGFDPIEAFDQRLTDLRWRFAVVEPEYAQFQ